MPRPRLKKPRRDDARNTRRSTPAAGRIVCEVAIARNVSMVDIAREVKCDYKTVVKYVHDGPIPTQLIRAFANAVNVPEAILRIAQTGTIDPVDVDEAAEVVAAAIEESHPREEVWERFGAALHQLADRDLRRWLAQAYLLLLQRKLRSELQLDDDTAPLDVVDLFSRSYRTCGLPDVTETIWNDGLQRALRAFARPRTNMQFKVGFELGRQFGRREGIREALRRFRRDPTYPAGDRAPTVTRSRR